MPTSRVTVATFQSTIAMRKCLAVVTLAFFLGATPARAQYSTNFNNSGFSCFGLQRPDCFFGVFRQYFLLTPGEYWRLTMNGTGLRQVTGLNYSLVIANGATKPFTFDVILNGTTVGSGVIPPGVSPLSANLSFSPVFASGTDDFTFDFRLKTTREAGGLFIYREDSVIELTNTGISQVPEPSTYALMAAGVASLGLVARRRRRALVA